MVDEAGLRAALGRLLPAQSTPQREFVVADATGRMRIGVLCTDAGVYAEVANFLVPDGTGQSGAGRGDYCAAWAEQAGVFRFCCEVDLFYSDIEQTLAMSRQAAEAALAAARGEA